MYGYTAGLIYLHEYSSCKTEVTNMLILIYYKKMLVKVLVVIGSLSHVQLFVTPWTVALQGPSMEFSRQEYWSGLPFLFFFYYLLIFYLAVLDLSCGMWDLVS